MGCCNLKGPWSHMPPTVFKARGARPGLAWPVALALHQCGRTFTLGDPQSVGHWSAHFMFMASVTADRASDLPLHRRRM
jgi:hypothetical protein